MCQSVVLLKEGSGLTTVMTDAVLVTPDGDGTVCSNIRGERVALPAVLSEVDLLRHRIILERI